MAGTEAVYRFHSFRVDPARRLLLRGASPLTVTAKVFDLLMVLIRGRERVITRDELIEQLWPDTTVEDGNLSVGISTLRKALGSGPDDAPIIETLPRVGYRFVAEVHEEFEEALRHGSTAVAAAASRRTETTALALHLPAKVLCPDTVGAVPRERLFRTLDERRLCPITWLHASAGSGKTTLLSTYLRTRQVPLLWYDVDAGDADASSVFHYTRLAAQALLGAELELPVPRSGSPASQRIFVRRFFEELFQKLPQGACLVFDNYQDAASEPAYNDMFRELCSAITPRVRIIYLYGEALQALATGRPRIALQFAEQGLAIAENSGIHTWNFWLLFAGALGSIGLRAFAAADRMSDAITQGPENQHHFAHAIQAYVRGWLAFEREDLDDARRWNQKSMQLAERTDFHLGRVSGGICQLIYEAAAGDASAIAAASSDLDERLGPRPTPFLSLAGDFAKTYARLCSGERAEDSLRDALVGGQKRGYGVFLGSRVISRLVSSAFDYGIELQNARELERAYELDR